MSISLQLQGELQSKKDAPRLYRGVFHGVSVILKNEGPKGLFRGIGAAVCYTSGSCLARQLLRQFTVRLSNDPQRLPSRLLRTIPQRRDHSNLQRRKCAISRCEHLLRRRLWCSRCRSWLSLLPRQDPLAIILPFPSCRHSAWIQECSGWVKDNQQD